MTLGKKIAIGVGVVVLALAVMIVPMIMTMSKFHPAETAAVTPEFFALKDKFVDIFVLKAGEDLICFDAGNKPEEIEKEFAKLGLDPLKVKAVFLTHSDGDHVNGLPAMKNAVVYLPEKEEPLVKGTTKRKFLVFRKSNPLPVANYTLIKDGEQVKFGKTIVKAILTPGHTIGSTSFLANGKYLIVGDLAITKDGKLIGMPTPPAEEPAVIEDSLKTIAALNGIEYIATAHGGVLQVTK